jgi:hypothetical protein
MIIDKYAVVVKGRDSMRVVINVQKGKNIAPHVEELVFIKQLQEKPV